jgi:hypothetical protein
LTTPQKNILTTAVDDIDKKAPTNTPSDDLAPHVFEKKLSTTQLDKLQKILLGGQGFYYSVTYVEETAKAIYRLIGASTTTVRPHKNMNNAI